VTTIVKPALGSWHVGGRVEVGVAVPVAVGVGVGVAPGSPIGDVGRVSRFWTDDAVNVTFWLPPKNAPMSGVSRRKCPLTTTLTVFPIPVAQLAGEQVTVTSVGLIATPFADSS
jgi:hypothetical protein